MLFPQGYLVQPSSGRQVGLYLFDEWWPTALISLAYVVGTYRWRDAILRQRAAEAKDLVKPCCYGGAWVQACMVAYNFALVLYSLGVCLGMAYAQVAGGYNWLACTSVPHHESPANRVFVLVGFAFYLSKIIELFDTLFFLIRGKTDQVSFLHVFHHASMPLSLWWGVKFAPQGMIYMFPLANSFIHVLMYTYYGLAAAGAYRYLWWKSQLTMAQMIQFVVMIIHQGQIFVLPNNCDYPRAFPAAICVYSAIFLVLFGNFYVQAYWKRRRQPKLHLDAASHQAKATGVLSKDHRSLGNGHTATVSNGHSTTTTPSLPAGVGRVDKKRV